MSGTTKAGDEGPGRLHLRPAPQLTQARLQFPCQIIQSSDLKVQAGQAVGSGSYGRVYKAKWMGNLVAVKELFHAKPGLASGSAGGGQQEAEAFLKEVRLQPQPFYTCASTLPVNSSSSGIR